MSLRILYDDICWEKSDSISLSWSLQFVEPDFLRPIGEFLIEHHKPGDPDQLRVLRRGAFNLCLRMDYEDSSTAVIRFVQPGSTMFPEEKICNEVAMMRFLHNKSSIPVPAIFRWGTKEESPLKLSSFILMEHIEHLGTVYDALNWPGCPTSVRGTLNRDIVESVLEDLYRELSSILLRMSTLSFDRIGSLGQVDDSTWDLGSLPQSKLPSNTSTFKTASSYYECLAELHVSHFANQRNDYVIKANDCRRKFVARRLFLQLARDHKLTRYEHGPFSLWCDDFRPANVLIDDSFKIVGVVDWEFTYAAPLEFSHAPPWWLLIEKPEKWPKGLENWCSEYDRRLQTFLRAMEHAEDDEIKHGRLDESKRLSGPMRDSWESGDFWIPHAARDEFAFDEIYWKKIDQRFFGSAEGSIDEVWKQRLDLLGKKELDEMEELVALRGEYIKNRELGWDPDEYTLAFLESQKDSEASAADETSL